MMTAVIVVGLASFYITYTVRYLEGPFGLHHKVLSLIGVIQPVYDNDNDVVSYVEVEPDRFITKLVSCFWCVTTWVCLAVTVVYGLCCSLSTGQLAFVWLASSGLSGYLHERSLDGESE
jgi:hypothetical protein